MKTIGALILFVVLASTPAAAGLRAQCRKQCKPVVATCIAETGQSRRKCRKAILRQCKEEGLAVCIPETTSTTTPTTSGDVTTTTSVPTGGTGGGVMSLHVNEATVEGDEDPRLYTLNIDIKYSITTADAVAQIGLDPTSFTVLDEDTGAVYPAEPAAAPQDCSADDVITRAGQEREECTLRFRMPRSVGASSEIDGGSHAKLQFNAQGLRGSDTFAIF